VCGGAGLPAGYSAIAAKNARFTRSRTEPSIAARDIVRSPRVSRRDTERGGTNARIPRIPDLAPFRLGPFPRKLDVGLTELLSRSGRASCGHLIPAPGLSLAGGPGKDPPGREPHSSRKHRTRLAHRRRLRGLRHAAGAQVCGAAPRIGMRTLTSTLSTATYQALTVAAVGNSAAKYSILARAGAFATGNAAFCSSRLSSPRPRRRCRGRRHSRGRRTARCSPDSPPSRITGGRPVARIRGPGRTPDRRRRRARR